jgi:mono/diheme cytochrome c family protein
VLTAGGPSPPVATGLDDVTLAIDVAVSPDRQKVALAVAGNNPAQGPTVVQTPLGAASPSRPLACRPAINEITTMPEGQVVAVAYGPTGVLFAQTREPATLWRSDTLAATPLASDSREDTGHFLFHANSGGGLACASCHPEGGEDGRAWNLVCVGNRRTQSLLGGLRGTEPFHWDGHEADFSQLVDDVYGGRMAGPVLSDDQKDALLGWIETLPALPQVAGLDPAAIARGKRLFEDATIGCATCHAGSRFTDNATLDVGTGRPYQVPTLSGLVWRAPFMHDGCAATIADRFASPSCSGGDRHGSTASLNEGQVSDLTAFLTSL